MQMRIVTDTTHIEYNTSCMESFRSTSYADMKDLRKYVSSSIVYSEVFKIVWPTLTLKSTYLLWKFSFHFTILTD